MYIKLKESSPWESLKCKNGEILYMNKWKEVNFLNDYMYIKKYLDLRDDLDAVPNNTNDDSVLSEQELSNLMTLIDQENEEKDKTEDTDLVNVENDDIDIASKEEYSVTFNYNNMTKAELATQISKLLSLEEDSKEYRKLMRKKKRDLVTSLIDLKNV